jgi:hypothetical protein
MNQKKLTLLGDIDPVKAVSKLRKFCHTEIVSIGPPNYQKRRKSQRINPLKVIHSIIIFNHHNLFKISTIFDM